MPSILAAVTTLSLCLISLTANAGCLDGSVLQKLKQNEIDYMLGRIPPAFADAVADKRIQFENQLADGDACRVNFEVTLPEDDVKQANELLAADPAKKIILFSQGYALPETTNIKAAYTVDPLSLEPSHADILQSGELGKLRAGIEMMYAMLTQKRAAIDETNMQNKQPWNAGFREQQLLKCSQQVAAAGCECQVERISAIVGERQLRYLEYVDSNPYAQATGASKNFAAIKRQIQSDCAQGKSGS